MVCGMVENPGFFFFFLEKQLTSCLRPCLVIQTDKVITELQRFTKKATLQFKETIQKPEFM